MAAIPTPLLPHLRTWQDFSMLRSPATNIAGGGTIGSTTTRFVAGSEEVAATGAGGPSGALGAVALPNPLPAHDPTVSHLQDQLASAMDQLQRKENLLSALQSCAREKDLLISSLSEERNEYQSLCSAYERKLGKKEGDIIKLTAKLARLDAQVGSLAQKNNKAKPVTKVSTLGSDQAIELPHSVAMDPEDGTSGQQEYHERQTGPFKGRDLCWLSERRKHSGPETSLPSPIDTAAKQDSDATIDRLTTKLAEQARQILIITQEFEKLQKTRTYLEKTIGENEESMARLRINVAKERDAANGWKMLFTLSRGQPHIHGTSTVGIFDAHKRRIAELEEKLSECYEQLVASLSQKGGVVLVPCNVVLSRKANERPSAPI
ncbi:hypothetical protein MD484_g6386, partial [Candolleomyces efflorescens]